MKTSPEVLEWMARMIILHCTAFELDRFADGLLWAKGDREGI